MNRCSYCKKDLDRSETDGGCHCNKEHPKSYSETGYGVRNAELMYNGHLEQWGTQIYYQDDKYINTKEKYYLR